MLLKALRSMEAQEKLELININAIPHMTKDAGQKIIQGYIDLVNQEKPFTIQNVKENRDKLAKILDLKKLQ